jgi:hypothetical protein
MDIKQIIYNQMNYFNTSYVKVYNMLHCIVVELLSNYLKIFVFQIFHYFSAPTAKKDQHSTTIDTMKDNWPTQVDEVWPTQVDEVWPTQVDEVWPTQVDEVWPTQVDEDQLAINTNRQKTYIYI